MINISNEVARLEKIRPLAGYYSINTSKSNLSSLHVPNVSVVAWFDLLSVFMWQRNCHFNQSQKLAYGWLQVLEHVVFYTDENSVQSVQ